MDLWIVLNIVFLCFETITNICFTISLNMKNKFCFEVSAYVIKSFIYLFAYLGTKQLQIHTKELAKVYTAHKLTLIKIMVICRGVSFLVFTIVVFSFCIVIFIPACFRKSIREKRFDRLRYISNRSRVI